MDTDKLNLRGKRVLVMGLGLHGGGVETVKFLVRSGAKVIVTDLRTRKVLKPSLQKLAPFKRIKYVLGKHRKKDIQGSDLLVKNPGVPPDSAYLLYAQKLKIPITSDVGLFFKLCPAKIIGVTGTRGKSTTVYLLSKFLEARFKNRVFAGGNIRRSVLEILPKLNQNDWVVLELSSFQLADLNFEKKETLRGPNLSLITNIFPEHLNWHSDYKAYILAKKNIFRFQRKNDLLFIPSGDKLLSSLIRNSPPRVIKTELPASYKKLVKEKLGEHYFSSVGLAIATAKHLGVKDKDIKRVLEKFRGLEGREEELNTIRGVHFINDTTSTSPEAAVAALKRFKTISGGKRNVVLIAGGQEKGVSYKDMARAINIYADVAVLLPGTATKKIKNQISKIKNIKTKIINVNSLRNAVKTAYLSAKKGDYVILSPGAASFGLFLNEFDRGEKFVKEVSLLK